MADNMRDHIKWLHKCLRESGYCIDGGKCHSNCDAEGGCSRERTCVPLSGSALRDDWLIDVSEKPPNNMLQIARRNLRAFIGKATFSNSVDKLAAFNCLDEIENALGERVMRKSGAWSAQSQDDLGHVVGPNGERIATVYGKEARQVVDAHNASLPSPNTKEPTLAARDVLTERRRQIEQEGHTLTLDDHYGAYVSSDRKHQLIRAAIAYAMYAAEKLEAKHYWPWGAEQWKPSDIRRNCVKAAALLLAEIERLDRATEKEKNNG